MNPCCAKYFRIATTNVQYSAGLSSETKWWPRQSVNGVVPQCLRYVRLPDNFVMFGPCWHRWATIQASVCAQRLRVECHHRRAPEHAARHSKGSWRGFNGVVWVLHSDFSRRDLSEVYGPRTTCYKRFVRCGGLVSGIKSWTRWPPGAVRRSFPKARTQPHTSNWASISESAVFGVSCAGNWARWSLNKTPRLNPSSATRAA